MNIVSPALIASVPLVLAACSNLPLGQSTTEYSTPNTPSATVATAPQVILPVVLQASPKPAYPDTRYPSDLRTPVRAAAAEFDCVIDEQGRVLTANMTKCSNLEFGHAATHAIKQWTFRPGSRDGIPVAMHVIVPVEYVVDD